MHLLSYILLRAVLLPFRLLPLRVSRFLGRGLGAFWFAVDFDHRGLVLRNLRIAYGAMLSEKELRRMRRRVFASLGMLVSDFGWGVKLTPDNVAKYVRLEGLEHYQAAHTRPGPIIIAAAHQACFEWSARLPALTGRPLYGVQRKIKNPWLYRFMTERRARFGTHAWEPHGAVARLGAITEDCDIGLMMDQRPRTGAVDVTFFGKPAQAMVGAAVLALRHNMPVIPGCLYRTPEGMAVRFGPPLELPAGGDTEANVRALTQAITDKLEAHIRERPEEWFWVHDRWGTAG